jgi:predicted metal-dependent phosphoesterase TrpH
MSRLLRVTAALAVTGGLALAQSPAHSADPGPLWLTGDTHVHTDHSSDGSTTRQVISQDAPGTTSVSTQIAAAERRGLDYLPLTDHRTYEQQWDPQWTSSKLLLIPGEEANGSPHANVLGASDDLVDGANPAGSAGYRHVQQSIWDVHAQDAVWQTNHPDDGETNADETPNANASAVGVDQVEIFNTGNPEPKIDYLENRWNAGFRFGVVAASDDHFSELDAIAGPGLPATRVAAAVRSERGILDGFRAGHTSVHRGTADSPVATLDADLDGDGTFETLGGDERPVAAGKRVQLRVRVHAGTGSTVYVYRSPGRSIAPLATLSPVALDETFLVPVTVPAGESWYRVEVRRAGGLMAASDITTFPDYRPTDPANQFQAATSPVFLYTDAPAVARPELPLPATSGTDAAAPVVGEAGGFAGFADVATSGPRTHVVAEQHAGGRTSVVYRLVGPGRDTAPVVLAAGAARYPRIAAAGQDVWVTWQDERSGQQPRRPDVYLRHSRDGGRTWAAEQRLTGGTSRAERPVVALLPDGTPVVAWMDNRSGAFDVLVQRVGVDKAPVDVAAPGKTTSAGYPFDSRSPRYPSSLFPSVAVAPNGTVAVGWQDNRFDVDPGFTGHTRTLEGPASGGTAPDDYEVLVSTLRPGSTWSAPANASRSPLASDRHPSLLFDPAGTLHVAWDTRALQAAGANLSLREATSQDGLAYSAPEPVAVAPEAMSQKPRLALDADGTVRIAWYDSRSDDWRWKVFTAKRSPTGWSAATQLSGPANGTYPAVAGGRVVFTSDRAAVGQRDRTQQVFLLDLR